MHHGHLSAMYGIASMESDKVSGKALHLRGASVATNLG